MTRVNLWWLPPDSTVYECWAGMKLLEAMDEAQQLLANGKAIEVIISVVR